MPGYHTHGPKIGAASPPQSAAGTSAVHFFTAPAARRAAESYSHLPLAHFNIINLSGKSCGVASHTPGSRLNLGV